jgi:hypothetical protein
MAKDNIGLLNEISASLRQMNMAQVRQNLESKAYQEQQLAVAAGGNVQQEAQFLPAGEDFKRRVKASLFTAKIAENFTESGERAERSNKESKKSKKFNKILVRDKRVGLGTIVDAVKENSMGSGDIVPTLLDSSNKHLSLIKVNSDALVQMLGGIRTHLGMSNKATEKARKKAMAAAANVKRTAAEDKVEKPADKVKGMKSIFGKFKMPKNPLKGRSTLMKILIGGLLAAAAIGITNMVVGWKSGGFMGAIKAMFFGNGEGGLGNAIAAAFSTGATFATAGLAFGPVGALVGGIIGMTVGAITGWLGKEKMAKMMSGAGATIGRGMDIISGTLNSWGNAFARYIFTPGTAADPVHGAAVKATMFGGKISFHMPPAMTAIGEAVAKVWQGVKDFGTAVKNAVIMLLPDKFTDAMGWTVNGMVKGENAAAPGAHHANYEKYNDGTNHGLTMAAASQVEAFTAAVKEQVDYVASFDSEGRRGRYDLSKINDAAYTLADGTAAEEFNNKMKSTGHSRMGINTQDLGDNMAMGPNRRYARGERVPPANVIVKQPDTNINTDQSVGAVIVNNNYFQDSPGGAADIHTIYSPAYPGGREMPWFIRGGTQ